MADWSAIRKKLEEDYLCPALRGRVQYFITVYRKSHDHDEGRGAIRVDGVELWMGGFHTHEKKVFECLKRIEKEEPEYPRDRLWDRAWIMSAEEGVICEDDFWWAFSEFDNQSIEKSLCSEHPLVRVFALLDRRVGKRRLLAMRERMQEEQEEVRRFYHIRMEAEGLEAPQA